MQSSWKFVRCTSAVSFFCSPLNFLAVSTALTNINAYSHCASSTKHLNPPLRCIAASLHSPLPSSNALSSAFPGSSATSFLANIQATSFFLAEKSDTLNAHSVLSSGSTEIEAASEDRKQGQNFAEERGASMLSVRINVTGDIADSLAESLMCFGASSCSIEEATVDEFQEKESCITVLFAPELDVGECIAWAVDSIGLREMPAYTIEEADDQDWIQKVQDVFRPVEVASGLWIVPRWCVPPDPAAINVMLDPGLAFGTGDHPTTRLCLRWLHQNIKGGEHILDYGTGSGILSITALKIGARKAAGVDIDPMAISSAQANALINNLDSCKLQVFLAASNEDNPPPFERFKFDIVVANILMLPLLQLVERITNYAKPGGRVAVSGIVTDQVDKVVASYSVHLENVHVWEDDGWACVSGTRKV
ncbi:hypothetical protein O6H91_09G045900 [Diphasiastrum complanatum]|uniref:Uncharacterized protein n=1 Tax=Diphasiastrum complanatum TaxID=34168 RepID=A0ACC2CPT0_DIPCM|nr:hypothetical protein O6H91_09G045900 [Diphasiastrum complanatum]